MSLETRATRLDARLTVALGAIAACVGLALLALYPLSPSSSFVPGGGLRRHGLPGELLPPVLYASVVYGPLCLTWGVFAVRERTLRPLSVRRSAAAVVVGALAAIAGLAHYTYLWVEATPVTTSATEPTTLDPTVAEAVHFHLFGGHPIALAAISATVVGTVAAQRGWRAGFATATLPAVLIVFTLADVFSSSGSFAGAVVGTTVLGTVPFVVGYLAARSAENEREYRRTIR